MLFIDCSLFHHCQFPLFDRQHIYYYLFVADIRWNFTQTASTLLNNKGMKSLENPSLSTIHGGRCDKWTEEKELTLNQKGLLYEIQNKSLRHSREISGDVGSSQSHNEVMRPGFWSVKLTRHIHHPTPADQ